MKRFQEHGIAHLEARGRIVWVTPDGYGNLESIERLMRDLGALIPALGGPWSALMRASDTTLLIPEAESALSAAIPQLLASGLQALAVVRQRGEARHLLEIQFTRIFASIPLAFFDSEDEADAWLQREPWRQAPRA